MKANVIVALLLGLVIGFAVGKVMSPAGSATTVAASGSAGATDESGLRFKSSDFPAEMWTGMNDAQKFAVMKVMNDNICDCGCSFGTLANCLKNDPGCPNSPAKVKQAIALARAGKSADQIQMEMFKKAAAGNTAAAAQAAPSRAQPTIDQTVYKVPVEGSVASGPADAPVTIVEFSDYQCPFCGRANATIEQVQKEYGDKVRVVMKQLPLENMHPQARGAAMAALAAGEQGKYWEMHHKLFENIRALDDASLVQKAKDLGLNLDKFNKDRVDARLKAVVDEDLKLANSLGVTGTPGFFINGRKLGGAYPFDVFKKVIDEELVKAEALVKAGTPASQVYAKIMEKGITAPPAPKAPAAQFAKVDVPSDSPSFGPATAKVTIVEWSDFQCPYCARAVPVIKQIKDTYKNDVRVVFRHQPLRSIHPQAEIAAEASMAAHEQGKFWEMHDVLFANARALSRPDLEKYAQQLGLDMNKFKAVLDSGKYKQRIDADSKAGIAIGAGGTPTFFINGRKQIGANFTQMKTLIDEELAKANKLLASGVKPEKLYERIIADNTAGK